MRIHVRIEKKGKGESRVRFWVQVARNKGQSVPNKETSLYKIIGNAIMMAKLAERLRSRKRRSS